MTANLPSRWTQLRYHPVQHALWESSARFRVVSAGRRSGKTELAKRYLVECALAEAEVLGARFIASAPTVAQAKEIFWNDLIALTPPWAVTKINRTELTIELLNGARLMVMGLDRPQRIEGSPIRGIVVDEYANCQADSWDAHIRPALSDPNCLGWAWLIGVPEGRNHYYRKAKQAQACKTGEWEHFTWFSSDIVPASEIAAAKAGMDPLTYAQEYEGSFVTFEGRAYYGFGTENLRNDLAYVPGLDLIFCFDFNVSPGTASVWQEQDGNSCCIGEVWIPKNSNTPAVCGRLIKDWAKVHVEGRVKCYGDPTGGARGTAKVEGTDWEIIRSRLTQGFPGSVIIVGEEFSRVVLKVDDRAGPERVRVNALNARIQTADGARRLLVNPKLAPHMVEDFEGVRLNPDGSGEIFKGKKKRSGGVDNEMLTHLTDGVSYYAKKEFPLRGGETVGRVELY